MFTSLFTTKDEPIVCKPAETVSVLLFLNHPVHMCEQEPEMLELRPLGKWSVPLLGVGDSLFPTHQT